MRIKITILFASVVLARLPSGYLMHDISEFGRGWAKELNWLSGDSTAVWIEVPPNNPHLARLMEWDGDFKRTVIPAGVRTAALGRLEEQNLVLASVFIPDSSIWNGLGLELYYERGVSRRITLPNGSIPGLACWDGASDTIWFALCMHPDKTPVRFFKTFGSDVTQTDKPLPAGIRFPIGTEPCDTSGPCLKALFPPQEPDTAEVPADDFMAGIVPGTNIDFVVENGGILLIENDDTLKINPKFSSRIIEVAWRSDGKFALVSILGNPSRISLLQLVWPDAPDNR